MPAPTAVMLAPPVLLLYRFSTLPPAPLTLIEPSAAAEPYSMLRAEPPRTCTDAAVAPAPAVAVVPLPITTSSAAVGTPRSQLSASLQSPSSHGLIQLVCACAPVLPMASATTVSDVVSRQNGIPRRPAAGRASDVNNKMKSPR